MSPNPAGARLRPSVKSSTENVRQNNQELVLQTLYRDGAMSRADLARATGLTKVTISSVVADMVDGGILRETRRRVMGSRGKPPTELDIDRDGWVVVALDLTASDLLTAAVLTVDGRPHARVTVDREDATGAQTVEKVRRLLGEIIPLVDGRLLGVGVTTPGLVSGEGAVLAAANLGWVDVPLAELLGEAVDVPVHVANDANAAILAEYATAAGDEDLLLIRIDTGIGAAVIVNGALVHGASYAAGEIGHTLVAEGPDAPLCSCGRRGCLEAWLAMPTVRRSLGRGAADGTADRMALIGYRLGTAIAPVVAALGLGRVVLQGTEPLVVALRETVERRLRELLIAEIFGELRVDVAHEDDLLLRGALALVLTREWGIA